MGMFDTIIFAQQVFEEPAGTDFQTKDLENLMDTYHVTAKGELYCDSWQHEWVDDPTAFFKGHLARIEGSYRRVDMSHLTDYITFYTSGDHEFRTYRAHFIDGKLQNITFKSRERMNDPILHEHPAVWEQDPSQGNQEREEEST